MKIMLAQLARTLKDWQCDSKNVSECWEKEDWLSQLDQASRNALVFEHKDVKISAPKSKKPRVPDTAHVNIEEVGRSLVRCVD